MRSSLHILWPLKFQFRVVLLTIKICISKPFFPPWFFCLHIILINCSFWVLTSMLLNDVLTILYFVYFFSDTTYNCWTSQCYNPMATGCSKNWCNFKLCWFEWRSSWCWAVEDTSLDKDKACCDSSCLAYARYISSLTWFSDLGKFWLISLLSKVMEMQWLWGNKKNLCLFLQKDFLVGVSV